MTIFEDRKKGYERKFQQDQELAFKAKVRRDRLLGLWAAERLGLSGAAAEAYAGEVVAADFERPGDEDVIGKIAKDFATKGVPLGADRVRVELERCAAVAREQLAASG